ncbi:MAG: MGMT family protein [Nocardioidaceae bacterium]
MDDERERYVESVLRVVEAIPVGRVMSYGAVAEHVGRGGPRRVGGVLSNHGGAVSWWRVVRADGSLPPSHVPRALEHYRAEGTPLTDRAICRIDMRRAAWNPPAPRSRTRP